MFFGFKKETSGIKWVKILSKIDTHIDALGLKSMLFCSNSKLKVSLPLGLASKFHSIIVVFHTSENILCAYKKALLNV